MSYISEVEQYLRQFKSRPIGNMVNNIFRETGKNRHPELKARVTKILKDKRSYAAAAYELNVTIQYQHPNPEIKEEGYLIIEKLVTFLINQSGGSFHQTYIEDPTVKGLGGMKTVEATSYVK